MKRKNKVRYQVCSFCKQDFETLSNRASYCSVPCQQNAKKRKDAYNIPKRISSLTSGAKQRAKSKSVPFNLDRDFMLEIWEEQRGCCALTGRPFNLSYEETLQKGWSVKDAPSIDRIEPSLGYTKGNVRFVTYQVNMAKGVYSDEDFLALKRKAE